MNTETFCYFPIKSYIEDITSYVRMVMKFLNKTSDPKTSMISSWDVMK
jgi:hypothetical protein